MASNRSRANVTANSRSNIWSLGFVGGALGGLVMTVLMWFERMTGLMDMNLELYLGSIVTGDISGPAWVIGFIAHLVISGLIGLAYAAVFRRQNFASAPLGAWLGVAHWFIAGIALGFYPAIHPLMPEVLAPPGWYGLQLGGVAFVSFLILHMIYGAIVGGTLGASFESVRDVERQRSRAA